MTNRGTVSTQTIADKLKKVENDLKITVKEEKNEFSPLLFVNGHLDRKNNNYIAKNFALMESLNKEIKKTCRGVDLTVINYLIYLGLEKLKEKKSLESIEYSEFEAKLKDTY